MIGWAIGALVGIGLAALCFSLWDWARDSVAAWLREHGHADSWVMSVVIRVDQVVSKARRKVRIFVKGRTDKRVRKVTETEVDVDDLPDDVRKQIARNGKYKGDVTTMVMA